MQLSSQIIRRTPPIGSLGIASSGTTDSEAEKIDMKAMISTGIRKRLVVAGTALLLLLAGTLAWRCWSRPPDGQLLASGTIDRLDLGTLVARLESRELEAEASLTNARVEYAQQEALFRDGIVARQALDTAHTVLINSEAEFTPKNVQTQEERVKLVFAVKIAADNPDQELKPGMPADARVLLDQERSAS